MNRVAIFAHYDKKNIIDDYVVFYVKELQKIAKNVIFVSCCDLPKEELDKLDCYKIAQKHKEYDFGSYKRGFIFAKNNNLLKDCEELIFANDSCYGPLYPISEVFAEMEKKNCDFWGITKNNFGYIKQFKHYFVRRTHIQSYFIAFKNNIFTQEFFANFINSIKHEQEKRDIIINYEIGLSELLIKQGYKFAVLVNAYESINNVTILKWRQIVEKYKMPFIKKSLFDLKNTDVTTVENYEKYLKNYPCNLIKFPRKIQTKTPYFIKILIFDTLSNFPFSIRKFFTIVMKKLFPFVND